MSTPSDWRKPKHFAGTERAGEGNHFGHAGASGASHKAPRVAASKSEAGGQRNPFASRRGHRLARHIRRGG